MNPQSLTVLERHVDGLLVACKGRYGEPGRLSLTGANFIWGKDRIAPIKAHAVAALRAQEHFAAYGPEDAPLLPLSLDDRDKYRGAGGLACLVGFYARSLVRKGYDFKKHPSFEDFARGIMFMDAWGVQKDAALMQRFPPKPLPGMTSGACWDPAECAREQAHLAKRTNGSSLVQ